MISPGQADSRDRSRLLRRIHRRYATTAAEVQIGNLKFTFTRISDPDRVLDELAAEADRRERLTGRREQDEHLHLPYWAELWDSAMGLGQFLVRKCVHRLGQGPSVLDLGCGMGLSGTVAAALGARVLFADLESPALLFAMLNSLPWRGRVRTRRLNWRTDRLHESFDLILGADILYERAQWDYLEPFWRTHLPPGSAVILGEPGRQTGDLFIDWIKGRGGWEMQEFEQPVTTRPKPIRIFELRPQAK
jgi:predicted nicotinamide N-methyase